MKWEFETIDQYIQSKEFVDTAFIPLVHINLDERINDSVAESNVVFGVAMQMEDQLKGRVLLLPALPVYTDKPEDFEVEQVNTVAERIKRAGFKNVVFLTQNSYWSERQKDVSSAILIINLEAANPEVSKDVMMKLAQKMIPLLIEIWQKG